MSAWTRWALIAGLSVLAWVPSVVSLVSRRGVSGTAQLESPAKALIALGAAGQGVAILVAAYLVSGLERCDAWTCRGRARGAV